MLSTLPGALQPKHDKHAKHNKHHKHQQTPTNTTNTTTTTTTTHTTNKTPNALCISPVLLLPARASDVQEISNKIGPGEVGFPASACTAVLGLGFGRFRTYGYPSWEAPSTREICGAAVPILWEIRSLHTPMPFNRRLRRRGIEGFAASVLLGSMLLWSGGVEVGLFGVLGTKMSGDLKLRSRHK